MLIELIMIFNSLKYQKFKVNNPVTQKATNVDHLEVIKQFVN
jgi:hypothetical protein